MRILTWNVNVLRTVLDYHPFSGLKNKTVEGLLDELKADIFCFQEHKTRRDVLDKAMACPGAYDGFWTFPRAKAGYSGVCTYVDSRVCVPMRAEEGITGLLLSDSKSTMRPPWTAEERIGHYPDIDDITFEDEVDGRPFDPRTLDMEGRAVVCDFGMFVLFNLYCPNEGNETRGPYKMNFLRVLQARVRALMAAGREVILAGDINIVRAPIDSGEGGIPRRAREFYEHPARRIFNDWCHPHGPLIDVVRESFPDREGMFTCWNTKIDARPANYGSRIDYILCSPGLRPWIKGGDIRADLYGSDHCPVYIDLHDEIEIDGKTVHIRELLDPVDRTPSTAPSYPTDVPREAPEPPRFATKFFDEFSGKQRTLMSLWAKPKRTQSSASVSVTASPSASPAPPSEVETQTDRPPSPPPSAPLGIARAAFESLDSAAAPSSATQISSESQVSASQSANTVPGSAVQPPTSSSNGTTVAGTPSIPLKRSATEIVDLTADEPKQKKTALERSKSTTADKGKGKAKSNAKRPAGGQPKLAAFWSAPSKTTAPSSSSSAIKKPTPPPKSNPVAAVDQPPDTEQDELLAQALAEEEAELTRKREAKKEEAAPVWSNLFARKLPPLCTVHNKPCRDFIVKIQGPNKGKRFWVCSMPVGPGYDTGRSKRPREEVNHKYKCDFFLWDSANSRKEQPKNVPSKSNE